MMMITFFLHIGWVIHSPLIQCLPGFTNHRFHTRVCISLRRSCLKGFSFQNKRTLARSCDVHGNWNLLQARCDLQQLCVLVAYHLSEEVPTPARLNLYHTVGCQGSFCIKYGQHCPPICFNHQEQSRISREVAGMT